MQHVILNNNNLLYCNKMIEIKYMYIEMEYVDFYLRTREWEVYEYSILTRSFIFNHSMMNQATFEII